MSQVRFFYLMQGSSSRTAPSLWRLVHISEDSSRICAQGRSLSIGWNTKKQLPLLGSAVNIMERLQWPPRGRLAAARGGKVGDQCSCVCSVDCRGDKWQLDGLFPLLSAPLIRCCHLGHSYLRSTFTPRSGWRGKGQQPTKALGEDGSQKDEILEDLHLLTKKFKPQPNALLVRRRPNQTGMCPVGVSVLFSLSYPTVMTRSSTQP